MMKIHILLLRDTAPAMDLLSPQQSAALGPVIVPVTVASNWYLLVVRFLLKTLFPDIKLFVLKQETCHNVALRLGGKTGWIVKSCWNRAFGLLIYFSKAGFRSTV
jgi:hypothetical protein